MGNLANNESQQNLSSAQKSESPYKILVSFILLSLKIRSVTLFGLKLDF